MGYIAAGVAVAASAGAGAMQAEGQRKAASQQREAQRNANDTAYRQWRESRGEGGNAILPMYLPGGTERDMAREAADFYDAATLGTPEERIAANQAILTAMQPTIDAGDRTISGIYNGEIQRERMEALAPVIAARNRLAMSQAEGVNAALADQRNRIVAEDATRGYSGAGSYTNNRLTAAAIKAFQDAAMAKGGADLANEVDTRAINDAAVDLRLRSLDLPVQRASQAMMLKSAPIQADAARMAYATQPISFFKLGVSTPPRPETLSYPATPSVGGAALSGLAQGAGMYAGYKFSQPNNPAAGYGGTLPDNWNSLNSGQQAQYINALTQAQQSGINPGDYE